jgi:transposase-like protein
MWRFTRNNSIAEGFHTQMKVMQRQAYGFRNFKSNRRKIERIVMLRRLEAALPPLKT